MPKPDGGVGIEYSNSTRERGWGFFCLSKRPSERISTEFIERKSHFEAKRLAESRTGSVWDYRFRFLARRFDRN